MSSSSEKEISLDPFAADIFAEHKENVAPQSKTPENQEQGLASWSKILPRAQPSPINWTRLKNNLPFSFFEELPQRLSGFLAKLLDLDNKNVIEFLFLMQHEITSTENPDSENSWWLEIKIENSSAQIFFEIDNAFAVWLVDTALGEEFLDDVEKVRSLTLSESAILEFLSLNLAAEANSIVQSPIFKFRSLNRQIPVALRQNAALENSPMLVVNWQIVHQLLPSIIKIYLTPAALQSLAATENKLLESAQFRRLHLQNLTRRVKDLRMRLAIGSAELSVAEFGAAEPNDVLLLERNSFFFADGNLSGQAEIFLGDADNVTISGEIITEDSTANLPIEEKDFKDDNKISIKNLRAVRPLRIMIESFTEFELPATNEEAMAETSENLEDESIAEPATDSNNLAIENLAVTLRVELEARRLSLSEISNLAENQVLELGVRPTDAVNLLIDNKIIGRGEMVIVEDRLGVRITKLLR